MNPTKAKTRLVEQWLETLTPELRETALTFLEDADSYGGVSLAREFKKFGLKATEGAIKGWRERNL